MPVLGEHNKQVRILNEHSFLCRLSAKTRKYGEMEPEGPGPRDITVHVELKLVLRVS